MGDGEAKRGNLWSWIGVGCGGLLFLGVAGSCVGPAILGILMTEGFGGLGGGLPSVAPIGGPGGGGAHPGLELPDAPGPIEPLEDTRERKVATAHFEVRVISAEFIAGVEEGTMCDLEVSHVRRNAEGFWCQAELSCAGQRLYGGSGQGYFECDWRPVPDGLIEGYDPDQTAVDGDPAITVMESGDEMTFDDGEMKLHATVFRITPQGDAILPAPGTAAP